VSLHGRTETVSAGLSDPTETVRPLHSSHSEASQRTLEPAHPTENRPWRARVPGRHDIAVGRCCKLLDHAGRAGRSLLAFPMRDVALSEHTG
jgi:hypothetical protein